jgi:hypothetical protein
MRALADEIAQRVESARIDADVAALRRTLDEGSAYGARDEDATAMLFPPAPSAQSAAP